MAQGAKSISVANALCGACPLWDDGDEGPVTDFHLGPDCLHRGEVLRVEPCSCPSRAGIEVHGCRVHGECVLTPADRERVRSTPGGPTIRICQSCEHQISGTRLPSRCRTRVGMLSPVLAVGGVERWLMTLARYAVGVDWAGLVLEEGKRSKVDFRAYRELTSLMPVTYDRREILATSDVLLTWASPASQDLREFSGRLIHVIHGETDWSLRQLLEQADRADVIVAVSDSAARLIPERFRAKSVTIYNAIDPARLVPSASRAELRARHGLSDADPAVAYVGRWSPEKCPELAAEAARELGISAVYCAVGTDHWQRRVRDLVPHAAIVEPTRPGDALEMADALVFGSVHEAFGLVLLEAWHALVPVVSREIGAVPIAERMAGRRLTERIDDHATIGRAVRAAMDAPAGRVDAARQVVIDHFLPEPWAATWTRLLTGEK